MGSNRIVAGMTPHIYHVLPDQKDDITVSPLKENIFKMLALIPDSEFPEFVKDILTKVEGHTLIDITDGPGDEKQDLLTINKSGEKCLVQCKHTARYNKNYSGDELDRMVAACMRKDCKEAIFVTNSDLTPQAKKYITDKEYSRGQTDLNNIIVVDYWNDLRIWEKIQSNSDILHKWFSGLGQTHALRSFRFDLCLKELPSNANEDILDTVIDRLLEKRIVTVDPEKRSFTGIIRGHFVTITMGIQIDTNLGVRYKPSQNEQSFYGQAVRTLSIIVNVNNKILKYFPKQVKDDVALSLLNEAVSQPPSGQWWQAAAGPSTSFLYVHDISEPREIIVDGTSTYVKVGMREFIKEKDYCCFDEKRFVLVNGSEEDEDDESTWRDTVTNIQVVQWFDKDLNPVDVYNYQIIQMARVEQFKNFVFYAVSGIDQSMLMRIRRFIPNEWTAFQFNNHTLMWGAPKSVDKLTLSKVIKKIELLHLHVKAVRNKDRDKLLSDLKSELPPATTMTVSEIKSAGLPLDLKSRIFWLKKEMNVRHDIDISLATRLLTFKYSYENEFGFDNLQGKTTFRSHTSELRELLFDFFTLRGRRMMDISIYNNPITLSIRYRDDSLLQTNELALSYLCEFNEIYKELSQLIHSPVDNP